MERLSAVANTIRRVRRETLALHNTTSGDNEWSLGCRNYARTCYALRQMAATCEWLTILPEDEKPLAFTFAIGSIPFKFYHGDPQDTPAHYRIVSYAELHQQQLALEIDGYQVRDKILRLAVETDISGDVSSVILVEMDLAGRPTETYIIPFDVEMGNIRHIESPSVILPPARVEPLKNTEEKDKNRNAGSQ